MLSSFVASLARVGGKLSHSQAGQYEKEKSEYKMEIDDLSSNMEAVAKAKVHNILKCVLG